MADNNQFERDKVCYEQNCQQMRSLNQVMWQVPMLAMTLTGGLWYAVATMKDMDTNARIALLLFSFIANSGLILMINRVRSVIGAYLKKIELFNPSNYVEASKPEKGLWKFPNRSVCTTFSVLMAVGALFSLTGAYLVFVGKWIPNPC